MFAAGFAVDVERMRGWRRPAAGRALLAADSAVRLLDNIFRERRKQASRRTQATLSPPELSDERSPRRQQRAGSRLRCGFASRCCSARCSRWPLLLRRETTALRLPAIGVGTKSGSTLDDAAAISAGFTLIDTKDTNLSLEALGAAIHASKLPRDAFFVVSKLVGERDPAAHAPAGVEAATRAALGRAKLALGLLHDPRPHSFGGTPVLATYRALENLVDAGLTRTVGLSNVRADQLEFLLREARIPPAVVEQEVHPYNQESALVSLCRSRGVALLAHSPLGSAKCARGCSPSRRSSKSRGGAAPRSPPSRWHVRWHDLAHLRANAAAAAAPLRRRHGRRRAPRPPRASEEYRHAHLLRANFAAATCGRR